MVTFFWIACEPHQTQCELRVRFRLQLLLGVRGKSHRKLKLGRGIQSVHDCHHEAAFHAAPEATREQLQRFAAAYHLGQP